MNRIMFGLLLLLLSFSTHASVVYYLASAQEAEVAALGSDQGAWEEFMFSDDDSEHFYLDKMWHGIHWLIARAPEATDLPASRVIQGGTEIGPDLGYGAARIFSPAEVKEIAALLSSLDPAELKENYDPAAMDAAGIVPTDWVVWDKDDHEGTARALLLSFEQLRQFYKRAADDGKAVVYAWN